MTHRAPCYMQWWEGHSILQRIGGRASDHSIMKSVGKSPVLVDISPFNVLEAESSAGQGCEDVKLHGPSSSVFLGQLFPTHLLGAGSYI